MRKVITSCPRCKSDFHWQEMTCKPGTLFSVECVQIEMANYGLANNGCRFKCKGIRLANRMPEFFMDVIDEFDIKNYLDKDANIENHSN